MGKLIQTIEGEKVGFKRYSFYCPGCRHYHWFNVDGPGRPMWSWNGSHDKPTVSPSILVRSQRPKGFTNDNPAPLGFDGPMEQTVCHMFVKDGMIQYLGDCTHHLAGQTVPMQDEEDD